MNWRPLIALSGIVGAFSVAHATTNQLLVQSFPLNPYCQLLDNQFQGVKFASDGACYFASSTHDNTHGAAFFRYRPDTGVLTMLTNDITLVCSENPSNTPPQGKIHSDIVEHNGWLYFATHLANYWPAAETNYTGAHVLGYELATGNFRDFGVIRSNCTIYAGIGVDPVRNKLITYTTHYGFVPVQSYLYRIDIGTGTNEFLGPVEGDAAFWFFVDRQGDCWISPSSTTGTLVRVNSATGTVDRWPNVLTDPAQVANLFWVWAQPLPDGDRCVFRLDDYSTTLYIFDANKFRNNQTNAIQAVADIGPYGWGLALGCDRVFYIQRANQQLGQQGTSDFHLLSVSLETNAPPVDHGLVIDQSGRLVWRIPGLAADPQGRVYMVGDWWLLPGEQGSPTGTVQHADTSNPNSPYIGLVRGEFFALTTIAIDSVGDGLPDWWRYQFFDSAITTNSRSCATCDPDGDGMNNRQEYLTGTDPTNSAAAFHITSVERESNGLRVTWTTSIGRTDALQRAPGSFSANSFVDIFAVTNTVGSLTNYLDLGATTNAPARFYRVRLVP